MRKCAIGLAVVAGLLLVLGPADVFAGGKRKTPSASKILAESYKNLVKAKSYRAKFAVVGGVTESKVHAVTAKTVNDTYTGVVQGRVMEVSKPRSYRTQKSGAIRKDGRWKSLLAARDGARMDRLFIWPQVVMQRAMRYKGSAEWIDTKKDKKDKKKRKTRKSSKKKSGRSSTSRGKTAVAKKGDSETTTATTTTTYFPGTIRVEAPPREALKHVIEVENSGCLSGG